MTCKVCSSETCVCVSKVVPRRIPEVDEIVTDRLLSGRMSQEEWDDLDHCPDDSDCFDWWENGVKHRKWNNGAREYRSQETKWRWKPYRG